MHLSTLVTTALVAQLLMTDELRKRNEPQMNIDFKKLLKNSILTLRVKLIINTTLLLST